MKPEWSSDRDERERFARMRSRVIAMSDMDLAIAMAMFSACDEPLRKKLGANSDWAEKFIASLVGFVIKRGRLTWKQREVARQIVYTGRLYLEAEWEKAERQRVLGGMR